MLASPVLILSSVSNDSKPLKRFQVGVVTGTKPFQCVSRHRIPGPLLSGQFPPGNLALASPAFSLQLRIGVLIVSQDDLYVNDAVSGARSPADLGF